MSEPARPALRVIGVGNRDRGDDAIGPIICDRLAERADASVATCVVEAGGVDLATYWDDDDRVVVIDALPPNGRPGRIVTVDALDRPVRPATSLSTHEVDVGASIELARALDALPSELTIVGIEGIDFEFGAELSTPVAHQVDDVVDWLTTRANRRADDR